MALKNGEQYVQSIAKMRPNIYKWGKPILAALTAGADGETRARAARLVEWLTVGGGIPGCMHGGVSPDGARLVVRAMTQWEEYAAEAKRIAGISAELSDPAAANK